MIRLLKLDVSLHNTETLETKINIFLDEIRAKHHIYNTEIKVDSGFIFVIISHSFDKMVY